MGLNFSHGDARFGYIQFNRILRMIEGYSLHLNYVVEKSKEYGDEKTRLKALEKIECLKPLLERIDCDGELSVSQLKKLCPVLNTILCEWEIDKISMAGFSGSIRDAIDSNEPLRFI